MERPGSPLRPSAGWAPAARLLGPDTPTGSPDPKCESATAPFPHVGPFFSTALSRRVGARWGYPCLLRPGSSRHSSEEGLLRVVHTQSAASGLPAPASPRLTPQDGSRESM